MNTRCLTPWLFLALFSVASILCGMARKEWIDFDPPRDSFTKESRIDLRYLNEAFAGEKGRIEARESHFIHAKTGETVRFWAVNMSANGDWTWEQWQYAARLLAKYGVNLVRFHGPVYQSHDYSRGGEGAAEARHRDFSSWRRDGLLKGVAAMKAEGIYSLLSIHFPLWLRLGPEDPEFPGYTGNENVFAIHFFNENFQKLYQSWWEEILLPVNPRTGQQLLQDPCLMGVELVNEDSLFFHTFRYGGDIPDEQMALLEGMFGDWLVERYGDLSEVRGRWNLELERDRWPEGRVAFRTLYEMPQERTPRDKDTLAFLVEVQKGWYEDQSAWLRELGYPGLITASNWVTADDRIYDGLERYTYLAGDFIDHHNAYFGGLQEGEEGAAWSIRAGHSFYDRSQLLFQPRDPARREREYGLLLAKPTWNDRPTTVSETSWIRPNRHRSESPLLYAAYGSLHDMDAIIHFAFDGDGSRWTVRPQFWMQQWTLMSPAVMAQFPATSLLYRKGLVATAPPSAIIHARLDDLLSFQGLPVFARGGMDAIREVDVPGDFPGEVREIDPLRSFVGPVHITICEEEGKSTLPSVDGFLDHSHRTASSFTGEIHLDWEAGILTLNAPTAQGFSLARGSGQILRTRDVNLATDAEILTLIVVSLDGSPLASAGKMLLQVMTEERASGFATRPVEGNPHGMRQILDEGQDPWQFRSIEGTVTFENGPLRIVPLDHHGKPIPGQARQGSSLKLEPDILYYLLERE